MSLGSCGSLATEADLASDADEVVLAVGCMFCSSFAVSLGSSVGTDGSSVDVVSEDASVMWDAGSSCVAGVAEVSGSSVASPNDGFRKIRMSTSEVAMPIPVRCDPNISASYCRR